MFHLLRTVEHHVSPILPSMNVQLFLSKYIVGMLSHYRQFIEQIDTEFRNITFFLKPDFIAKDCRVKCIIRLG